METEIMENVAENLVENTDVVADVATETVKKLGVKDVLKGGLMVAGAIAIGKVAVDRVIIPLGKKGINGIANLQSKAKLKKAKDVTNSADEPVDVPEDVEKTNPIHKD